MSSILPPTFIALLLLTSSSVASVAAFLISPGSSEINMSRSALAHRALSSIHPARRRRTCSSIQSAVASRSLYFSHLSASSYNTNNNPDPNEELQNNLRQLTLLNDGKSINPRSPRQVSTLLYKHNEKGPTDKSTLMKIIMNDVNADEDEEENERQRKVAKLVLKCRELLALVDVGGAATSSSLKSETFLSRVSNGMNRNNQIANFSSIATSVSSTENDTNNESSSSSSSSQESKKVATEQDMSLNELPVQTTSSYTMSPYDQMVMDLFPNINDNTQSDEHNNNDDASIDPYWVEPLLSLTKSSSRSLVRQLQHQYCPMGYDPSASPFSALKSNNATSSDEDSNGKKRTTSLLSFIRNQKQTHFNEAIMLVRVGDFYETYGVDAIMLVEHCGLNPMAGKAVSMCWPMIAACVESIASTYYSDAHIKSFVIFFLSVLAVHGATSKQHWMA